MTGALDSLRETAKSLIADFGKTATLRRATDTFSASTGDVTRTTSDTSVTISPPGDFTLKRLDGTLLQAGDTVVQIAAKDLSLVPSAETDSVIIDSEEWSVVEVGRRWSGTQVATYVLVLRKK